MTDLELLQQVQTEYDESLDFLQLRKKRWVSQLMLLVNLGKPDEQISTASFLSFFIRVVSSLYNGQMNVTFVPPEAPDFKRVEMLNKVAQNDYQEMGKKIIDYDEIWSCGAFGRSYTDTLRYDKKRKLLVPEVISPLFFFHDPFGALPRTWRYYGFWLAKSRSQLNKMLKKGLLDVPSLEGVSSGMDPYLWDFKTLQDKAKSATPSTNDSASANSTFQILRWHTIDQETGDKYLVLLDKERTKILKKQKLDLRDDPDDQSQSRWPLVVKEIFRDPFSSMPLSCFDIMEDKSRALNVLYNLMYIAAKDEANPIYSYDKDMVVNVADLSERQIDQHIAIDTSNGKTIGDAIAPLRAKLAVSQGIAAFINILKSETAEAVGTAQISQPIQKNKKSATEAALLQQIADATQSLQALILEAGEEEFWSHWYWRHRRNARKADLKVIALTSVSGVTFESLDLADATRTRLPPRVLVQNVKKAEYKKQVTRKALENTYALVTKTMSPKQKRDYDRFIFYPHYDFDQSTLDLVFPKTIGEMKAEQENELLDLDRIAPISPQDDDAEHIFIHLRGKRTAATWAHVLTHEEQLASKMQRQEQAANKNGEEQAKPNDKVPNPAQAAVPLKNMASTRYSSSIPLAQA